MTTLTYAQFQPVSGPLWKFLHAVMVESDSYGLEDPSGRCYLFFDGENPTRPRHATITKDDRLFDYTRRKFFPTLEAWWADVAAQSPTGATALPFSAIRYGRVDGSLDSAQIREALGWGDHDPFADADAGAGADADADAAGAGAGAPPAPTAAALAAFQTAVVDAVFSALESAAPAAPAPAPAAPTPAVESEDCDEEMAGLALKINSCHIASAKFRRTSSLLDEHHEDEMKAAIVAVSRWLDTQDRFFGYAPNIDKELRREMDNVGLGDYFFIAQALLSF